VQAFVAPPVQWPPVSRQFTGRCFSGVLIETTSQDDIRLVAVFFQKRWFEKSISSSRKACDGKDMGYESRPPKKPLRNDRAHC
jgi:hypothetical protein